MIRCYTERYTMVSWYNKGSRWTRRQNAQIIKGCSIPLLTSTIIQSHRIFQACYLPPSRIPTLQLSPASWCRCIPWRGVLNGCSSSILCSRATVLEPVKSHGSSTNEPKKSVDKVDPLQTSNQDIFLVLNARGDLEKEQCLNSPLHSSSFWYRHYPLDSP